MTKDSQTLTADLKPCPFCGGEAMRVYPVDFACIECKSCRSQTYIFQSMATAETVWNGRAALNQGQG